ncbi:MAG TPA: NADH-quinone oxidoreductase subunit J [Myxococcales bacterium]|nr:NADH-quinone oxidoreductase subunit J [Myxococcales bacterium]HIN86819.1 NADH-quinone oxidoreductase subunit J [Myxococcales bacterium]
MVVSIIFWLLAAGCILFASMVVIPPVGRNPVYGAISLVGCFFCLSGLYVLLAAHLLAAIQIIVYAGAIMVLFTFVIMLLNLTEDELGSPRYTTAKTVGVLSIAFVFTKMIKVITEATPDTAMTVPQSDYGSLEGVGTMLLRDFLLPFELVSILLLVAIIGAVILAKKKVA